MFEIREKINWKGGRLWEDQIEETSKDGEIPDGMQAERDSDVDVGEEDKSVNEDANIHVEEDEDMVNNAENSSKLIGVNKEVRDKSVEIHAESAIPKEAGKPSISSVNPKEININMGDPGGTGNEAPNPNKTTVDNREIAKSRTKNLAKDQTAMVKGNSVQLDSMVEGLAAAI
ncbi:hypothetical protein A4A49_18120 [Nicotiana attenuata]|uniref:Uncharacterized protein n=1 Tax=Nicotiana attenuata TaxID=49451 RepID=A0A1J6IL00_NICAT|nr:hypothetical protein A4A49_18120 [Nicotiana attenuata]